MSTNSSSNNGNRLLHLSLSDDSHCHNLLMYKDGRSFPVTTDVVLLPYSVERHTVSALGVAVEI